jgi:hypothetical protein
MRVIDGRVPTVAIQLFGLELRNENMSLTYVLTVSDRYGGTDRCQSLTHRQFEMCDSLCEHIAYTVAFKCTHLCLSKRAASLKAAMGEFTRSLTGSCPVSCYKGLVRHS